MSISTDSDPRLYITNVKEIVVACPIRFEKSAAFKVSKRTIESMKEHYPDFKGEYVGLVEAPTEEEEEGDE